MSWGLSIKHDVVHIMTASTGSKRSFLDYLEVFTSRFRQFCLFINQIKQKCVLIVSLSLCDKKQTKYYT